jgi:hypothetical protein
MAEQRACITHTNKHWQNWLKDSDERLADAAKQSARMDKYDKSEMLQKHERSYHLNNQ